MTLDDSLVRESVTSCTVELMYKREGGYIVFVADEEADVMQVRKPVSTGQDSSGDGRR